MEEAGPRVSPQATLNDIDAIALKSNAAMSSDRHVMTEAKTNSSLRISVPRRFKFRDREFSAAARVILQRDTAAVCLERLSAQAALGDRRKTRLGEATRGTVGAWDFGRSDDNLLCCG